MLILDHGKVERLFDEIEHAEEPNRRLGLVAQLEAELTRHTRIEESILYPFIRESVPGGAAMMNEAEREHAEARKTLAQVGTLDPAGGDFDLALASLKDQIDHHVAEAENQVFPTLKQATPANRLAKLRAELDRARLAESPSLILPDDARRPAARQRTIAQKPTSSKSKSAVWVQPHHLDDRRWQVRREQSTRASRIFDTQADAEAFGRAVARRERVEFSSPAVTALSAKRTAADRTRATSPADEDRRGVEQCARQPGPPGTDVTGALTYSRTAWPTWTLQLYERLPWIPRSCSWHSWVAWRWQAA